MSNTNGNGRAPEHADYVEHDQHQRSAVEALTTDIELALADELHGRRELEALLTASKEREANFRKAIAALGGKPPTTQGRPASSAKGGGWSPSEERITFVFEQFKLWIAAEPELEHTKTKLAEWITEHNEVGVAHDTVSKCMDVLRERELVRITGTVRGGGKTWALMPETPALHAA